MKIIFNPFERFRENSLLVFGIIFTIAGSVLAWPLKARFDGILDLHFAEEVAWYQPLLDNLVNILIGTILLFVAGFVINRKTRLVDMLTAILIARLPLYFLSLFNVGNYMSDATHEIIANISGDPQKLAENINVGLLGIFGIISLVFIVWFVALLYNGYRVASNAKGPMAIVLFVFTIILAEVVTKWIIVTLS